MTMPVEYRTATITKPDGSKKQVKLPVRLVPVAHIAADSEYQRDLDNGWVQKQKRTGWNDALAQVLTLSARGGRLYCVDGQHRLALARECGVEKVWAYVIEGLTKAQEADLFTQFQLRRRALKVWELFKADMAADKEQAVEITKVVHKHKLRIERSGGPGCISAIGALTRIYALGGRRLLDDTLGTILREWTLDDEDALRGQVMHGVAIYLFSFQADPNFDPKRLDKVMPRLSPSLLIRKAQKLASERASASVSPPMVAEALKQAYNEGLAKKNQLGDLVSASGKRLPTSVRS